MSKKNKFFKKKLFAKIQGHKNKKIAKIKYINILIKKLFIIIFEISSNFSKYFIFQFT